MAKRIRRLPFIPLQLQDMDGAFAGKQYQMLNDSCKNTERRKMFKDAIYKLLYSNFKWYGMDEDAATAIEYYLINEGKVCAVKTKFNIDERTPEGIFFGRFSTENMDVKYDFYGNPTSAACTGFNGMSYTAKTVNDFAIGFDSCANFKKEQFYRPLIHYVEQLATELDDAYAAWKVAAETRKLGMIFNCKNKQSKNLLQRVISKVSANDPYVIVEGGNLTEDVDILFAPSNMTGLSEYHMNFMNVWGSVLDLLGLENNSQNKRERLVVTEAEMNRSLSRYLSADRLKARKEFCDVMNARFNTNYRVENYLASVIDENMNEANVEGITTERSDRKENG